MKFNAHVYFMDFDIRIHSDSCEFFDIAVKCFKNFAFRKTSPVSKRIDIYLTENKTRVNGRSSMKRWEKKIYRQEFWLKDMTVDVNCEKGIIRSFVNTRSKFLREEIEELLIFRPLRLLLSRYDMLVMHAGCVSKDGDGILILGKSGSGKTTTTLGFTHQGFQFLGDEHIILRMSGRGVKACAFPKKIGLQEESMSIFPNLEFLKNRKFHSPGKKGFFINEAYPNALTKECCPRLIIFPYFEKDSKLQIRKISKIEAMHNIMRDKDNCGNDWEIGSQSAPKFFNILSLLLEQSAAYKVIYSKNNFNRLIKVIASEKFRAKY